MNSEYTRIARERTIIQALIRLGKEHLLPHDGDEEAKQRVRCEELPSKQEVVPYEDVEDLLSDLGQMAETRKTQLTRFRMVEVTNGKEEASKAGGSQKKNGAKRRQRKTKSR